MNTSVARLKIHSARFRFTESGAIFMGNLERSKESATIFNIYLNNIAKQKDARYDVKKEFLEDSQVYGLSIPIELNGAGELELTWNSTMPAGDYTLAARLEEKYNKEDVPALMRNYHNAQQYLIPITIQ